MIKKYILSALIALSIPVLAVYAATPTLTVSGNGDGNSVTLNVTGGEINAPVVLFYNSSTLGTVQGITLGTTNASGTFATIVNTNNVGVNWATPVYVQVGGYQSQSVTWPYSASTSTVMFSSVSPGVVLGQNSSVTLSGGSGSYYVSSNSNASVVTPSISGNVLTFYGGTIGQSTVIVCSTGGGCGTITVNVNSGTSVGSPTVNQSSINIVSGGQGSITLSGGTTPYTISVPSGSGISTTLSGNTLFINGSTLGMSTISVCSANGSCTPVTVNVQTATNTGGSLSYVLPVTVGQPVQLMLTGGVGTYYLQSPMSSPALASISGNTLMLNGSTAGSGMVTVCQTGGSSCLPIRFVVNPALTGTGGGFFFETDLWRGVSGQDVTELQTRLAAEGYFHANVTGYFGGNTEAAVKQYQRDHGISTTGYVGAVTRARLNQ